VFLQPHHIGNLPSLQELWLDHNQLQHLPPVSTFVFILDYVFTACITGGPEIVETYFQVQSSDRTPVIMIVFLWFLTALPDKYQDNAVIAPWPFPSKFSPVDQLPFFLPFGSK
jgi:Leucine-rich repeat (LRR) protein